MEKNPLVSVIIPCYNGEKVVATELQSILDQTYSPIELIFVNDGSTDKTEEVFQSFQPLFEARNISVNYIYQKNRGLGGAIDTGIRQVKGEFFCWPDADDYLEPTSIADHVEQFRLHPEAGVVTADSNVRDVAAPMTVIGSALTKEPDISGVELFERMLDGKSVFFPGSHMIRYEFWKKAVLEDGIYPARRGQNWQLLLPMYYHYPRVLLRKPLYNYMVFPNSMSRGDDTYERKLYRMEEHETIITETLKRIRMEDTVRQAYQKRVRIRYARHRLALAWRYANRTDAKKNFAVLRQEGAVSMKDRVYRMDSYVGIIRKLKG